MKSQKLVAYLFVSIILPFLGKGFGMGADLFAQKILKDTMVNVVKSFQPTIADAYKINNMPVVRDSIPPAPQLSYNINPKKIFTPFIVDPIKSAKMMGEPLTKLHSSLVKLGAGNYSTPYAEIFYNNLRSKEVSYGTRLKHFSSKSTLEGYGFSGFSNNEIELYGKKFLRKQTLSGNLDYNRDVVHYYGYDTSMMKLNDNSYIKQRYSTFGGNISLQSHHLDSSHINYLTKIKYYNLSDFYNVSESNISALADVSGYYEKQLLHIPLSVEYYNNKTTVDTTSSFLIGLTPYLTSVGDKWNARIGIGIALEKNQDEKSRFFFYPNIDFNYNVVENIIIPYAGVSGGLKKNSLRSLTGENPFLIPSPAIKNTNERWEIYGGLKGSISKTVSYSTRTSYSNLQDLYLFVNDTSDFFKKGFNAVYDDAKIWNLHGELQFQYSEKIKVIAKGDYNKYTMKNELKPWHKPLWKISALVNYNLEDKIIVTADVFLFGKRDAKIFKVDSLGSKAQPISLKNIVDVNIGLEYRYSKKLSAFLHLNNLAFRRYLLWNDYPSQKFNFLLGVTMVL